MSGEGDEGRVATKGEGDEGRVATKGEGDEGCVATKVLRLTALLEAVVALVARTRELKAILLEDRCNEGARVCD